MVPWYFEDFSPGRGTLKPRAALDSDAARVELSGAWAFRFSPKLQNESDGLEQPQFDDTGWDRLDVPSHRQLRGYGIPEHPVPDSGGSAVRA